MPTFYRPSAKRAELAAVVWNPRANAVLADFSQGNKFQTDDPYVIQKLRELGYPTVEDYEDGLAPPTSPPAPLRPHELQPRVVKAPVVQVKGKSPVKKGPALKKRTVVPQGPADMDTDDVSPSKR